MMHVHVFVNYIDLLISEKRSSITRFVQKTLNLLSFRCFQSIHMDPSKNIKKGAYRALHNVVH